MTNRMQGKGSKLNLNYSICELVQNYDIVIRNNKYYMSKFKTFWSKTKIVKIYVNPTSINQVIATYCILFICIQIMSVGCVRLTKCLPILAASF